MPMVATIPAASICLGQDHVPPSFSSCSPGEDDGQIPSCNMFHATAVVGPAMQMQCTCAADTQACPTLSKQMYHPVVGKDMYCPVLVGCLPKDNTAGPPPLL